MSACFIFQFVPDILGPSLKKVPLEFRQPLRSLSIQWTGIIQCGWSFAEWTNPAAFPHKVILTQF